MITLIEVCVRLFLTSRVVRELHAARVRAKRAARNPGEALRFYPEALYVAVITAGFIGYQYGDNNRAFCGTIRRVRKGRTTFEEVPQNRVTNLCVMAWQWHTCAGAMFFGLLHSLLTDPEAVFATVEENRQSNVLLTLLARRRRNGWWKFWKRWTGSRKVAGRDSQLPVGS